MRSNARRGITDIKDNVGSPLGQGFRDFRKLIIALVCWDGGSGCCYTERCAKQNRTKRLNGFAAYRLLPGFENGSPLISLDRRMHSPHAPTRGMSRAERLA